ncbi:6666_t:CDS:2 [Gigaspora rosea]|nr:6666_t:CDS:2 [Gigaspora rosea]
MSYKKALTDSINNDFPKKEQLLKARRDWAVEDIPHEVGFERLCVRKYGPCQNLKDYVSNWCKIPEEFHEIIARFSDNYDDYDNNLNEKVINSDEDDYNSDSVDENIDEEKDSMASIDDVEDTTSEESKDLFLVEFNSYEIKNKISIMKKLSPRDLLPNGIVNHIFLQKYHKWLFDRIVKQAINMYFDDVGIGTNHFLDISADQAIFRRLVPLRTAKPEIRLLLGGWHTKIVWKNYYGDHMNPPKIGMEDKFMFCEISNGPYALDWDYYWRDELRLGKFSKDSWNNIYLFAQKIDASDQLLKEDDG